MPGGKHIVVIFDNKHSLKPQRQVCDNRYGKSVVNKPIDIWQGVAEFAKSNHD